MTEPLALVLYEKLLPGTQLVNRLQDLRYRVQTVSTPERLLECAEEARPLLVLVDVDTRRADVLEAVRKLRLNEATSHLPVIGFGSQKESESQGIAPEAGFTLLVSDAALLNHLEQCLERALQVD